MFMKEQIDVLIVEDNLIDQKLIANYLREYDFSFKIASDGHEAQVLLESHSFYLILLDLMMPKIDGFELAKIIRQKLRLEIPIVAITAFNINEVKDKCFAAGMNGCFSRPIQKIELVGMLTQFLPNEKLKSGDQYAYEVIDLSYLKEVSLGDEEYEIEVIGKFIETIDQDLLELQQSFAEKRGEEIKMIAHRTLSTIYIVGLRSKLETSLRSLENMDVSEMGSRLDCIHAICNKAKAEAQHFIDSVKQK